MTPICKPGASQSSVTNGCRIIDMFVTDDASGFKSNRISGSITKSGDPYSLKVDGMQKNVMSPTNVTKALNVERLVNERTCASKKKNMRDRCTRKTNCMFCWQHGYYPYGETDRTCGYKFSEDANGMLVRINP